MNLYRVWARYEPDHINLATGRRGQWRVELVSSLPITDRVYVTHDNSLSLPSTRPYRKGVIIRPHKVLNRVLAARRQA